MLQEKAYEVALRNGSDLIQFGASPSQLQQVDLFPTICVGTLDILRDDFLDVSLQWDLQYYVKRFKYQC
ncbi:hypothetical protein QTP88_023564 [Uroleucon formosanum]